MLKVSIWLFGPEISELKFINSFAEAVDNPMRSSGAPNNRHVHVHGFDWVVDNAMRSSGIDESVHGFASAVDNGIMSSNLEVSASALVASLTRKRT